MKKVVALAAFVIGVALFLASSLAMAVTMGFGTTTFLPIFLLSLGSVWAGYRYSHPVLRSR